MTETIGSDATTSGPTPDGAGASGITPPDHRGTPGGLHLTRLYTTDGVHPYD
jgi:hypothetical protein